jgi:Protein of unknown function (DUF3987)
MSDPDHVRLMESVARHFFGDPNQRLSKKGELRFGNHGSLSIDLGKGVWFDHEACEGGGPLDLIRREIGISEPHEAYAWAEREGFWTNGRARDPAPNPAPKSRVAATYDYTDEGGEPLSQVVRYEPKAFRQQRPDGQGGWIWNITGVRRVPYRLPELIEALGNEQTIIVAEGEKDVDNLRRLGAPATCNLGGAGKWHAELNEHFAKADVVIIADNDPQSKNKKGELLFHADGRPRFAGWDHAIDVAKHLRGIAASVRVVDLKKAWPQCPDKGDISDWIEAGLTIEALNALIEQTPTWNTEPGGQSAVLFDPWERYIVPDFPLHVLPPAVRDYVTSQATVIGCDPCALAMAALTAISGALDHRFAVKMMRNGNWWEHPRLWTLLVGDPSRKKTPIINDVTRPLERHQNDLRRDYEARLRDYEAAKESGDKSIKKPDPPVRYVVWDTTTEKLGEILSRSEHGLLVKRDEFAGWIGGMEKYSSGRAAGADRGFWLQAFDGGPHAVDRVGRGETYIRNLSVSLLGGIQPAKLMELDGLTSDGLLQRFLPVLMRSSALARDCASGDEQDNYQTLVYKLIKAKPQRFAFSDAALFSMNELRAHLHQVEQATAGLADGLQAFVGKLAGIAGRLAVILHMAENPEAPPREIDHVTVSKVRTLVVDFLLPHAVEFYRSAEELTNGERVRKIASWILTSGVKMITARDLTREVRCLRGLSVMDLNTQMSPLVAGGWLEPKERSPLNRTWTVAPVVASQFKRQREIEEERKGLAAKLMGSPKTPQKPTGD